MATKKEKKAPKVSKDLDILKGIVGDLFDQLSLTSTTELAEDKENEALIVNVIGEEETGLLIGARGRTLASLQTVIGLIFRQKTGNWKRIILNVSDWREKEEDRLRKLAADTAVRVKESGETQNLYNLNPSQRRIVHMALSEEAGIKTESQGEGSDRFLVVSPK